jgi:4-amino-4-deoxy-L-arabinose transferase-like glycosyltransferase
MPIRPIQYVNQNSDSRQYPASDLFVICILAAFTIFAHLATNNRYGFHRDELYYLACANHLDFGYVDHPPLIAWLGAFIQLILGKSLFAIRLVPAIAAGAIVMFTGFSVRQLGGGRFALTLGCLAVMIAPLYLSMGMMFTTNVFEQLIWAVAVYLIISVLKANSSRALLLLGLILGLGMLNKYTMFFYAGAAVTSLIFTSDRKLLKNRFWQLSIALVLVILLPNLLWQLNHGWPTLEFIREASINRMEKVSPIDFLSQQFFSLNPINFFLMIAGLYYYLVDSRGKAYRLLGIMFILLFAFFAFQHSKDYYLAPAYPMIWIGGALLLEKLANRFKSMIIKVSVISVMIIAGIIIAPFSLPVLNPEYLEKVAAYEKAEFPLVFKDMMGWENMAAAVAKAYNGLPSGVKSGCAVLANNYGEAAAIDYYGEKYGLPKAICAHNSYWIWGPRDYTGEQVLSVGLNPEDLAQGFGDLKKLGDINCNWATWYECNLAIHLWSKPRLPLKNIWPYLKMYY